jgi:hypothetical protein
MFQCIKGICCVAEGNPQQRYNFPIWVYANPEVSARGELKVWSMTRRQYEALTSLYPAGSLTFKDMIVLAQKSGKRTDLGYTKQEGNPLIANLSNEDAQAIIREVENFYARGDSTLHRPMGQKEWEDLYRSMGRDPHNLTAEVLPPGQSGAQYLPPPQVPSAFPNQVQQNPAPPIGNMPQQSQAPSPFAQQGQQSQASSPVQPAQAQQVPSPFAQKQPQGQPAIQPQAQQAPSPFAQQAPTKGAKIVPDPNTVEGTAEVSQEDLGSLIDD